MHDPNALSRRNFLGAAGATLIAGCSADTAADGLAADTTQGPDSAFGADTAADTGADTGPDAGSDTGSEPDVGSEPDTREDLSVPDGMTAVAAVAVLEQDVEAAVRRAVALAGGIDEVQAGQTVFVKPNAVHPFALGVAGITTSGSVVGALVKMLKERGATVIVGDRCARGFSSSMTLNDSGIAEAAEKAGADEIFGAVAPSAEPDAWVLKQPPGWEGSWQAQGGIQAMRKIVEADHFINVAVCKDHRWAGVSLTMKNLIGAVGDDSRDQMHYVAKDVEALSRDIATLNGAFSPLLNLVDAQSCVVNGGPEGIAGDAVITAPGLIIAGRDRVAVDALGTSLIQYEQVGATVPDPDAVQEVLRSTPAWQLPQLTRGIELGLGVAGPDAVVLRLEGLDAALQEGLETRYRA